MKGTPFWNTDTKTSFSREHNRKTFTWHVDERKNITKKDTRIHHQNLLPGSTPLCLLRGRSPWISVPSLFIALVSWPCGCAFPCTISFTKWNPKKQMNGLFSNHSAVQFNSLVQTFKRYNEPGSFWRARRHKVLQIYNQSELWIQTLQYISAQLIFQAM